jgi:hypothetical protein
MSANLFAAAALALRPFLRLFWISVMPVQARSRRSVCEHVFQPISGSEMAMQALPRLGLFLRDNFDG